MAACPMPIHYRFYAEYDLVYAVSSGRIVFKDFKEYTLDFLCKDPRIKSGYIGLNDMRTVTSNELSRDEMLTFIELGEFVDRPIPSKMAFVVSDDYNFANVRQYAAHAANKESEIKAFRDIDEAKQWLGIETLQFDQIL